MSYNKLKKENIFYKFFDSLAQLKTNNKIIN